MTKRDVAVWFCKVFALYGIANAASNLVGNVGSYLAFKSWAFVVYPLPALTLYFFVFLLSGSLGTELAAEGEHGEPITSSADLRPLLLRCVGFALFLASSLGLAVTALSFSGYYFSRPRVPPSASMTIFMSQYLYQGAAQLLASGVGFFFAFGPRIRAAMQSR